MGSQEAAPPGWGWGSSKEPRPPRELGPRTEGLDREAGRRPAGQPSGALESLGTQRPIMEARRQRALQETELRNTCLSQQRAGLGDHTPRMQTRESIS